MRPRRILSRPRSSGPRQNAYVVLRHRDFRLLWQAEFASKLRNAGLEADTKEREAQLVQGELTNVKAELDRERVLKSGLQSQLTEATSQNLTLEASNKAMKEKINFLESDSQAQSQAFNDLHRRMQEAIEAEKVATRRRDEVALVRVERHAEELLDV